MHIFIHLIVSTVAVFVTAYVLPGVEVSGLQSAFITAIVVGILNTLIRPVLVLLTLPVTILTLGLFTIVINALLIMLADFLVDGFKVDGFFWAIVFSIILSIVGGFLHSLEKDKDK